MLGVRLVIMCLFGYLGYREASKYERDNGRRAFGVPAWGWAAITAVSLLIGAVLLYLARRSAAKNPAPVAAPPALSHSDTFGWAAPDTPQREDVWAAPTSTLPGPQLPARPTAPIPTNPSPDILPGR